eukprot:8478566-Pyramimonas_sp.AAC.1
MDDGLTRRVPKPSQVCPVKTIAFDVVLGVSTQASVTTDLQFPGDRVQSSYLYTGRSLDTL